jgi:hypothetical protein
VQNAIAGEEPSAVDVQAETIARNLVLPSQSERIARCAAEWTRGLPRGWRQVDAVVARLRSEFTLDPTAGAAEDCQDVVEHFLRAKRGPDYLFATAAAVLLRSQGYPVRLAAGFYARGDRFDRRAGQTAVLAEDVHVWAEVCIDGRSWITIEPTPGYEPPPETRSWSQQLSLLWQAGAAWLLDYAAWIAAAGAVAAVLWFTRLAWCDWLLAFGFWVAGCGGAARRVRATLRLLEWRAWLAGAPRPSDATISRWYLARAEHLGEKTAAEVRVFIACAERLLYAPQSLAHTDRGRVARACAVVIRNLRSPRLRISN